ncbi:HesA/MoeB/ThiF family protein [Salinarimonas rosea]|uniref:HesA/MoeB/ThiF family protein n=1 Tax=Salinarimonas rosea TaxID=552063 RepID=UPI000421CE95|nr:HesA/MoeB/ThiF family protein [Salinarimonas rosea]
MTRSLPLTAEERLWYRRQTVLPEIGEAGQERLKGARVLVIGAGGLGSPLLLYLAGAGVGTLGIVDFDLVEVSNLHRQILHRADRLDTLKTESAEATLRALNPHVTIVRHDCAIGRDNAADLVAAYDIVADGSDNFATRDAVHAACLAARVPLVSAAAQLTDGLLTTFKAWLGPPHPCYRCLFPDAPPQALTPSCAEIGVLGPALGLLGSMQATAVIREILEDEPGLSGTLLMVDAWRHEVAHTQLPRRAGCPVCDAPQPPVTGGNRLTSSPAESS